MDKKFWFQLVGLSIVILGATFLAFNYRYIEPLTSQFIKSPKTRPAVNAGMKYLKITDKEGNVKTTLRVEIADSEQKRSKGLGFRESLASDSGMLFIHENAKKYTYWMKGMQFPIDIMWILDDKIADLIPNIPPPIEGQTEETLERFSSTVDVNRVLETNAGFVTKFNIQIGDKILLGK